MPIVVHIPTILRSLTQDRKQVEASGGTVLEVIESIEAGHPGVKARLIQDGLAHRFVNIYVNDDDIRFLADLATPVKAGDQLTILPAVAGGSGGRPCR